MGNKDNKRYVLKRKKAERLKNIARIMREAKQAQMKKDRTSGVEADTSRTSIDCVDVAPHLQDENEPDVSQLIHENPITIDENQGIVLRAVTAAEVAHPTVGDTEECANAENYIFCLSEEDEPSDSIEKDDLDKLTTLGEKYSQMIDNEQFIDTVRIYPILYDDEHSQYSDKAKKLQVWEEIGKKFQSNVTTCRNKWSVMKRMHSIAYFKKRQAISDPNFFKLNKFKLSQNLEFLNKYLERKRKNVGVRTRKRDIIKPATNRKAVEKRKRNEDQETIAEIKIEIEPTVSYPVTNVSYDELQVDDGHPVTIKQEVDPLFCDEVTSFLERIGASLRAMPPPTYSLAKSEICDVIRKYEMLAIVHTNKATQE